jgi:hypothetical protein
MFRSSTIIRELVLSLATVMLEHSVNYVLIGYMVVWQHVLEWRVCCVLCRMRLKMVAVLTQPRRRPAARYCYRTTGCICS